MARRRNKAEERQIVRRRIDSLLRHAQVEAAGPDAELADVDARRILRVARRYQMPLGPAAAMICRGCGAFRRSATTRVRISRGRVITTCTCGVIRRRPL